MSVMIGIDPHKGSHTAVVINGDEVVIEEIRVRASAKQVVELGFPSDRGGLLFDG